MATLGIVLLWIGWIAVVVISGFLTLMMFAFADSPGAGKAAKVMIGPILIFAILAYGISGRLLMHETGWSILLAFALTISPPFLVFLGYNLLM